MAKIGETKKLPLFVIRTIVYVPDASVLLSFTIILVAWLLSNSAGVRLELVCIVLL